MNPLLCFLASSLKYSFKPFAAPVESWTLVQVAGLILDELYMWLNPSFKCILKLPGVKVKQTVRSGIKEKAKAEMSQNMFYAPAQVWLWWGVAQTQPPGRKWELQVFIHSTWPVAFSDSCRYLSVTSTVPFSDSGIILLVGFTLDRWSSKATRAVMWS